MGRLPVALQAKHSIAELKAHYQNATNAVERRSAVTINSRSPTRTVDDHLRQHGVSGQLEHQANRAS